MAIGILVILLAAVALVTLLLGVLLFALPSPRVNTVLLCLTALWGIVVVSMLASSFPSNCHLEIFLSWCLLLPGAAGLALRFFSRGRGLLCRALVLAPAALGAVFLILG